MGGFHGYRIAAACGRPGPAPLIVVLDCKGGADARRIADRARRALRLAGARSTAIWPDEAGLSLWVLPPAQLTTTLVDLVEHGTGAAAYYADVMEAVVGLAVAAPGGPPASAAEFLARLDPGWLAGAYSSGAYPSAAHEAELALVRSASRQLGDIALRFRTLLRRLGTGLDGPGEFGDADAWYCILEGTAEVSVAEAQARALDEAGEACLAARLGLSARHLRRLFMTQLGITPDELARSHRAHFARRLLDDTDLSITEIAFTAGYGSARQFNRDCLRIFRATPSHLRAARSSPARLAADGGLTLRLRPSAALDWEALAAFLADRAVPGTEHVDGLTYRRTIDVDGDPGVLELGPGGQGYLQLRLHLPHWAGLVHLVVRARRIAGRRSRCRR